MTRRCDDCGAAVSDTIGSRQCSLFSPPDPRIDPSAAASLKAGRILCPACARGVPLEPLDTPEAVAIDLADGEADAADDGPGPTGQLLPTLDRDTSETIARELWPFDGRTLPPAECCRVAWVGQIDKPGGWNHRARLDGAHRALDLAVQLYGGRVVR
jgi:hypothetical protein